MRFATNITFEIKVFSNRNDIIGLTCYIVQCVGVSAYLTCNPTTTCARVVFTELLVGIVNCETLILNYCGRRFKSPLKPLIVHKTGTEPPCQCTLNLVAGSSTRGSTLFSNEFMNGR